jgi:LuxR family maltose regulon positive regulatory protein
MPSSPNASPAPAGVPRARPRVAAVETLPALPFDVLQSKLRVPDSPEGAVARKRLVNRLRAERSSRLATVVAPPGYGKTTLLAQWVGRDERPAAWLTLDERDDDPVLLLRHVAAALDRLQPVDPKVLEALARPGRSIWQAAAPRLAAVIASRRPFVLVLDEVDRLARGESAAVLATLAEHVPEGSLLALAGRVTPPLPISRLRARGGLLELRTEELALTPREARLLVRETGVTLAEPQVAELVAAADGWAAGLRLAVRAVEAGGTCAGTDRFLAEYLDAECLVHLPAPLAPFLRRTSLLERLSGPLCDAVLGTQDAASRLAELERRNAFLVPLDREGTWYRYHPLLRDLLRRELDRREPGLAAELHRRAADWLEAHGDPEAALNHAQESGDAARAARLLGAAAFPAYDSGRIGVVERWLERFADGTPLRGHAAVAGLGVWIHAVGGRPADVERWLEPFRRGSRKGPLAALLGAALCADGVEVMDADAEHAVARLPVHSPWLPTALLVRGAAAVLRGETGVAEAAFAAVAELDDHVSVASLAALAERSLLAADAGDAAAAERLALEALDLLSLSGLQDYPTSAIIHAAAARALLRHGRWDDARRELEAGIRLADRLTHALPWLAVRTRLALCAACVTLRDRACANAQFEAARRILELRPGLGVLVSAAADLERALEELPDPRDGHLSGLTRAELRLLPLLATHLSFREIGERLHVSRNTVKTQAISAYRKLGVSSRSDAIERASELGLVDEPGAVVRAG